MKSIVALTALLVLAPPAHAADVEAGKAKVQTVCAACHGASGVSVADTIPNLAGQKAGYIEAQLRALRDGSRTNPIMNPIAAQLANDDIANVAAYFSSLQGATGTAKSELLPNMAKTGVTFPENYKSTFTKYHTQNNPGSRQLLVLYANDVAVKAAAEQKPLPDGSMILIEAYPAQLDADRKPVTGADGLYVPDGPPLYTAMRREAGWGKDIPEMLRNEDWNYAVFTQTKEPRAGVNQALCLACHKPQAKSSYLFTLGPLAAAKK